MLKKHSLYVSHTFLIVLLYSWHSLHTQYAHKQTNKHIYQTELFHFSRSLLVDGGGCRRCSQFSQHISLLLLGFSLFVLICTRAFVVVAAFFCLSRWDAYLVDGAGLCNIKSYTHSLTHKRKEGLIGSFSQSRHTFMHILHLDLAAAAAAAAFFQSFF